MLFASAGVVLAEQGDVLGGVETAFPERIAPGEQYHLDAARTNAQESVRIALSALIVAALSSRTSIHLSLGVGR